MNGVKKEPIPRRNKAQMEHDRKYPTHNKCRMCGEKLDHIDNRRNAAKMCIDCRGYGSGGNVHVRQLFKELSSKNLEPAEDEMFFEDATNIEDDDARYIRVPVEANYGGSGLAEIMSPGIDHRRYKDDPEAPTKRESYRKGKESRDLLID